MQALSLVGVKKNKIETTYYNLHKIKEWDHKTKKQIDKGYRVTNTMKITLEDLNKVGDVLDTIVKAGVNKVNDVNFQLSDKKKAEVKSEALRLAAKNAGIKAESLALGAGVTLGKVRSIQEEMSNFYPIRSYSKEMVMSTEMDKGMPSTPISPGQVHIEVKVRIVFTI